MMDLPIVFGSAVVGLLVGLTGTGGGALMTPMLILLFAVKPTAAISSDLVATLVMRPVGALVHFRFGTVNLRLTGWLAAGSVPAAFAGTYALHLMGHGASATHYVELALGAALLLGVAAMVFRYLLDERSGGRRNGVADVAVRPVPTVAIGALVGFVVGTTSVGAGSLMIVLLMFAYPRIAAKRLVGTDLAQAIPLTGAAAIGALLFGHVDLPVTTSIIVGSVPAVLVGSLLSARFDSRFLRPLIGVVVCVSGLKYLGVGTTDLAWAALALFAGLGLHWVLRRRLGAVVRAAPAAPSVRQ